MPKDVLITPASANVQFKQTSGNTEGLIELTDDGYLKITSSNSGILLGDTATDVYIGDGVTSVDIIFEQSGAVRALTGKTLTIGQNDATVRINSTLQITNTTLVANLNADLLDGLNSGSFANTIYGNSAFAHANSAFITANSSFLAANGTAIAANTPSHVANSAASYANSGFAIANNSSGVNLTQNTNIGSAASYANSAFIRANNSLNANVGGIITGDISITGNLTVTGVTTYTNTSTVLIADNIITVNAAINQSAQPAVNAGIEVDRGAQPNSSFLWIETSGKWAANNGNGSIFIAADSAESYANSAFSVANAATATNTTQNTSIIAAFLAANTPSHVANSAASYANAAFTKANTASGASASGYLANSVIVANSTGFLSNTSNLLFIQSNNTLQIATVPVATLGDVLALSIALG